MAVNYKNVTDDSKFTEEMNNAAGKLVVADFTSARCPPCQRIAPIFAEMARKFPGAVLMSVDIQACPGAAQANNIQATPTFVFYRNKTKIDSLSGGDPELLEARIRKHYTDADAAEVPDSGVPGHMDLLALLDKRGCECLNQNSDHPYSNVLFNSSEQTRLESDADEQILLHLDFTAPVKVHSLRIKAPQTQGPKTLKLFINQPHAMDFDSAMYNAAMQEITLTEKSLAGGLTKLKYVKFQNVQNMTIFIQDNQSGDDVTVLNYLQIIGSPMNATNMSDFKRVAGKKGESH